MKRLIATLLIFIALSGTVSVLVACNDADLETIREHERKAEEALKEMKEHENKINDLLKKP